jgi:hypothetical protein
MKKYAVKLIGIVLIVLGFSYIYKAILQAIGLTTNTFVSTFLDFVLGGIALYGGINLVRLQEVGRKVSVVFLPGFCFRLQSHNFRGFGMVKRLF